VADGSNGLESRSGLVQKGRKWQSAPDQKNEDSNVRGTLSAMTQAPAKNN